MDAPGDGPLTHTGSREAWAEQEEFCRDKNKDKIKIIYLTSNTWGVVSQYPEPKAHDISV